MLIDVNYDGRKLITTTPRTYTYIPDFIIKKWGFFKKLVKLLVVFAQSGKCQ